MFSTAQAVKLLEQIFGAKVAEGSTLSDVDVKAIFAAVQTLTPREERIVRQRLAGVTLRAIGEDLARWGHKGLTSAGVFQAHRKAIRKLQHPTRSRDLKPILNRLEIVG